VIFGFETKVVLAFNNGDGGNFMNPQAQTILTAFDSLSEKVGYEVALEILRRTKDLDLPSLTDEDLVANAEALFLELDQRELDDERSQSR
jgi:hypothetical protein